MPQDTNTFADNPDKELVIRAKAGDSAAFEELYRRLCQWARNEDEYFEFPKEMIYQAWRSISTTRDDFSYENWLYEIERLISNAISKLPLPQSISLLGKHLEVEKPQVKTSDDASTLSIRIIEEPLTAQNLTTIISALTELYTKCWLIAKGRFADLSIYSLTHSARFAEEANLIINDITHNSPFNFDLSVNLESAARAMQIAIDSVSLAGVRKQEAELAIKAKELETKLKEQEAEAEQKAKEQTRQLEAQKAELERQRDLLELQKQQLEIEKQRFELHASYISYAQKTAGEMVDLLNPGMDAATKAMNVQLLIPNLLQLANGKGLELVLPAHQLQLPEPLGDAS